MSLPKDKFLTIPNLFSLSRLVIIIPAIWMIFHIEEYSRYVVFGILLLAGLTDYLDGWSARKLNQISEWGKILDPMADKITLLVVAVSMVMVEWVPLWYLLVLLGRDILIMIGGLWFQKKVGFVPPSLMSGKIAVNFVSAAFLCALLGLTFWFELFMWSSLFFLLWSFFEYGFRMINEFKKVDR